MLSRSSVCHIPCTHAKLLYGSLATAVTAADVHLNQPSELSPCVFRFVTPDQKYIAENMPHTPTPFKNALETYGPMRPLVCIPVSPRFFPHNIISGLQCRDILGSLKKWMQERPQVEPKAVVYQKYLSIAWNERIVSGKQLKALH